jgi:hypothetical protein
MNNSLHSLQVNTGRVPINGYFSAFTSAHDLTSYNLGTCSTTRMAEGFHDVKGDSPADEEQTDV